MKCFPRTNNTYKTYTSFKTTQSANTQRCGMSANNTMNTQDNRKKVLTKKSSATIACKLRHILAVNDSSRDQSIIIVKVSVIIRKFKMSTSSIIKCRCAVTDVQW